MVLILSYIRVRGIPLKQIFNVSKKKVDIFPKDLFLFMSFDLLALKVRKVQCDSHTALPNS